MIIPIAIAARSPKRFIVDVAHLQSAWFHADVLIGSPVLSTITAALNHDATAGLESCAFRAGR